MDEGLKGPLNAKEEPAMTVNTIDDYLANLVPEQQSALDKLRKQIRAAAPGAEECISYGLPAFRKGRMVCGFGAAKKHCALYMFSDSTLNAFSNDLSGYKVSKGAVRFQPDNPLPESLVKRLVGARLAECAALDAARK